MAPSVALVQMEGGCEECSCEWKGVMRGGAGMGGWMDREEQQGAWGGGRRRGGVMGREVLIADGERV
jgi:hypothetical protein